MKRLLLLSLALLAYAPGLPAADNSPPRMNVLFIVSDDLCNQLGCYGSFVKSPHIDKLAREGVRFDRAYCQFPLCNPSRASFLTGLRPDQLRVYENGTQFRKNLPDVQTLPQTFRKAGYYVARVGKLYHYGVPAQIGTDGLDDPPSWEHVVNPKGHDKKSEAEGKIHSLVPGQYGGTLSWLADEGEDHEQTDGIGALETVKLLEANKDRPFFIACGFYRPHTPYVAPKKWFDLYPTDTLKLPFVPQGHWDQHPKMAFGSYKKEQDQLTDDLRRVVLQAYHASTSFMDAQVGVVLNALERLNLKDRTIVVFTSDHGYHLGEHGLWQKMSLFENSARVPLVIYDPRSKGNGQASGRTVELVDLHPTLAELCGLPTPPNLTGKSLKPLLDNPTAAWEKPAYTQVTRGTPTVTGEKIKKGDRPIMGRSVRTERYRYTEWGEDGQYGKQLFDYEKDPQELKNLADDPSYATVLKEMKALLKKS